MIVPRPQYRPCGDRMVLAEFAEVIAPEINEAVHCLAAGLQKARIPGVLEWTPSYRSLGIYYDPLEIGYAALVEHLEKLVSSGAPLSQPATRVEIPVAYGGQFGPDLEFVASTHGLSLEQVIALHSEKAYRVYLIGFTPGFPYLGGLPEQLATPRLAEPRRLVPAGSVAIGGQQTGIYPVDSPGGWRIIGRTPLRLFDIQKAIPCLLAPGDEVVFRPIREREFGEIAAQVGAA
ncbi:MAG: 5-oxoprolinase subunit PxpB [Acidobacteria bacterium]|nr:5-oxoprolinase subunit PxpB [Acidobacteriota bacterium]MCI0722536.1 5-oxoprolinase subunit PxpB [Acidobacteriota bacterium]